MSIRSIIPSRAAGRHGALRRLRQAGMVGVYKEEVGFQLVRGGFIKAEKC